MEEVEKKNLGQLLHSKRVSKINLAYARYRIDPTDHNLNDLLKESTVLAQKKLRAQSKVIGDSCLENEDDYAQKVAITVWERLPDFNRSPEEFYPWLMQIIVYKRLHLFEEMTLDSAGQVPLTVEDRHGNEFDNPAIYVQQKSDAAVSLPADLSEEEQLICYMLIDGYKQKNIAAFLDIGLSTLELKIHNMKYRAREAQIV